MLNVRFNRRGEIMTKSMELIFLLSICLASNAEAASEDSEEYYQEGWEALIRLDQDMQTVIRFISTEQGKLHKTKELLAELESEHDKLKVLVDSDQEIVDALLYVQDQRSKEKSRRDLIIGFLSGVASSITAALIVLAIARYRRKLENAQA